MHHIISDEWSTSLLIQDVVATYESLVTGQPASLPELSIQYADFAWWQRQWLASDLITAQIAYWKRRLAGAPPALDLPFDRPRPEIQTFHGARHSFMVSPQQALALHKLSRQAGTTLFMTFLAAFKVLLYRYTDQVDLVVGTDVANRNHPEVEPVIGFFVNQLVLRTSLSGTATFRELLEQVREVTIEAYTHQDLPFDKLVEILNPKRDVSRPLLFQVKLSHLNVPAPQISLPSLTLTPMELHNGMAQFDLILFIRETEQGIASIFEYNTDLFDASTITRMTNHFLTLLDSITIQPDAPLYALQIFTEAEINQHRMDDMKHEEAKFKKFQNVKPKAIVLPQEEE